MIHLSTPTQTSNVSPGSPQERDLQSPDLKSGDVENLTDDWGNKAHKKNEPGIFAKLLDGLIAKGKTGSKSEADENLEIAAEPEEIEKNAFFRAVSGRFTQEPDGLEISGKESDSNAIFALISHGIEVNFEHSDLHPSELHQSDFNPTGFSLPGFNPHGAEDLHFAGAEVEFALTGENSFRELNLREANLRNNNSGRASENAEGEQNASAKLFLDNGENITNESPELTLVSKGKNAGSQDSSLQYSERQFVERQLAERKTNGGQHELSANAELKAAADSRLFEQRKAQDNLQEARGRRGRLNVDIRDLRTGESKEAVYVDPAKVFSSVRPAGAEIEIPVELRLSAARAEGEVKAGNQSIMGKGFEDAMARELRGNLSLDIVKQATVIARDGDAGTIRLSLRPASLGDVKIHLEMAENRITGFIVVESSEALRAFERELPVLEKAFRDSGFSETNLEMSLAQDGWNFANTEQQQEGDFSAQSALMAASRYEESERIELSDSPEPFSEGMILLPERTPVNLLV